MLAADNVDFGPLQAEHQQASCSADVADAQPPDADAPPS
jgi:hypothetical protein